MDCLIGRHYHFLVDFLEHGLIFPARLCSWTSKNVNKLQSRAGFWKIGDKRMPISSSASRDHRLASVVGTEREIEKRDFFSPVGYLP
ncbi:hypothetical protein Cflav_PD3089 [Pedosphaera parvula Ellin514]|uniref:Uncharacterized protein n=1 Tax=Pedosphaera parvula (strain Ellin514) TaxID=320771 RepID=B9XJG9_PEDPL|nr:hypothetical protein Cflav_PD3089 [Pedosphaera parvula Ellin514]